MEYLLDVIKKVAMFYVIAYFLLNLVNNEKYRHYIKMFVGIIMIIMLIGPVGRIFGFDDIFLKHFSTISAQGMSDDLKVELMAAEDGMKDVILEEYYGIIEADISEQLLAYDFFLNDFDIIICTDENNENYGKITHMELGISNKKTDIVEIPDIIIGNEDSVASPVVIEIKKYISDVYKINKNNINVNISL